MAIPPTKTNVDFADVLADLLEGRYADRQKITVVRDNLNTQPKGAFYEPFNPSDRSHRPNQIPCIPKHGSWLNIAENELSSMTRSESAYRGEIETLQIETAAWATHVTIRQQIRYGLVDLFAAS